jgi:hypothetical protein
MGGSATKLVPPPRKPVPEGKTRICVSGFTVSHHTGRARSIAALIAQKYPDKYESWFYFTTGQAYYTFLKNTFDSVPFPDHLKGHSSSPFVWLEKGAQNEIQPLGGRDYFADWAKQNFADDQQVVELASDVSVFDAFHNGDNAPQSTADIKE